MLRFAIIFSYVYNATILDIYNHHHYRSLYSGARRTIYFQTTDKQERISMATVYFPQNPAIKGRDFVVPLRLQPIIHFLTKSLR